MTGMKRDWTLMHRYIFHMLFLEDGTMASLGVICQPCTCSTWVTSDSMISIDAWMRQIIKNWKISSICFYRLEAGYLYEPDGSLHPIEWTDLTLYQHGENGTPPKDHAFSFKAGNRKWILSDIDFMSQVAIAGVTLVSMLSIFRW